MLATRRNCAPEQKTRDSVVMSIGGGCVLVLVISVLICRLPYLFLTAIANLTKYSGYTALGTVTEAVFTEARVRTANQISQAIPVTAILIIFVVLRAKTQLIAESDSSYRVTAFGIILLTGSLAIIALEGISLTIESPLIGNIGQTVGTFGQLIGSMVMLWALIALKSDGYDSSTAAVCFVVIAFVGFVKDIVSCCDRFDLIPRNSLRFLLNSDHTTASLFVLLYISFLPWIAKTDIPTYVTVAVIGLTVSGFLQTIGGLIPADTTGPFPVVLRVTAALLKNLCLMITVYFIFVCGAPSQALLSAQILLGVAVVHSLASIALEEVVTPFNEENTLTLQRIHAQFSGISTVCLTLIVLFFFVHTHTLIEMSESNVSEKLSSYGYLVPMMYIAVTGLLIHVVSALAGMFWEQGQVVLLGVGGVLLTVSTLCVLAALM